MRIELSVRARRDRAAIFDYISEHSPQGARRVIQAIQLTLGALSILPESGRATDLVGTRSIPVKGYPYRVFYRLRGEQIVILHIRHTSRRPFAG